ncbi:MAG: DUF1499 domain-containing protein [Proteobacteria bacterium]|nr:DUF1499 domain-containing protein [Pseudomonadota bacterium]
MKPRAAGWLVLGLFIWLSALSCGGEQGGEVGLIEGKLKPCPGRPNCVCSEYPGQASWIAPLSFEGDPKAAWQRLGLIVKDMGGRVEQANEDYFRATFRSRVFRFIDDAEFRLEAGSGLIHVRSASRVGYSDFGVNRKRVRTLRARFEG